jgi:hypothetical protein
VLAKAVRSSITAFHPALTGTGSSATKITACEPWPSGRGASSVVPESAVAIRVSLLFMDDPVLFQHLFWLYSHPALYVMSLSLILTGGGLWLWKRRRSSV